MKPDVSGHCRFRRFSMRHVSVYKNMAITFGQLHRQLRLIVSRQDEILARLPPPRPLRRDLERLLRRQLYRRPL